MTNRVDCVRLSFQVSVFFGVVRTVGEKRPEKKSILEIIRIADMALWSRMCAEKVNMLLCNFLISAVPNL